MNERFTQVTASAGLIIGGIFGTIGSFATSDSFRGLAWGIDGIALVVASSLLTIYYFRKGLDSTAAGFLIFAIGQGLVLSYSGADPYSNVSIFGAGASCWAAALFIISLQKTYPLFLRCTGVLAAVLFLVSAILIFSAHPLNALTKPLPFFAYPVFVITMLGWAWNLLTTRSPQQSRNS